MAAAASTTATPVNIALVIALPPAPAGRCDGAKRGHGVNPS